MRSRIAAECEPCSLGGTRGSLQNSTPVRRRALNLSTYGVAAGVNQLGMEGSTVRPRPRSRYGDPMEGSTYGAEIGWLPCLLFMRRRIETEAVRHKVRQGLRALGCLGWLICSSGSRNVWLSSRLVSLPREAVSDGDDVSKTYFTKAYTLKHHPSLAVLGGANQWDPLQ